VVNPVHHSPLTTYQAGVKIVVEMSEHIRNVLIMAALEMSAPIFQCLFVEAFSAAAIRGWA
jgi:hypothetical protein